MIHSGLDKIKICASLNGCFAKCRDLENSVSILNRFIEIEGGFRTVATLKFLMVSSSDMICTKSVTIGQDRLLFKHLI